MAKQPAQAHSQRKNKNKYRRKPSEKSLANPKHHFFSVYIQKCFFRRSRGTNTVGNVVWARERPGSLAAEPRTERHTWVQSPTCEPSLGEVSRELGASTRGCLGQEGTTPARDAVGARDVDGGWDVKHKKMGTSTERSAALACKSANNTGTEDNNTTQATRCRQIPRPTRSHLSQWEKKSSSLPILRLEHHEEMMLTVMSVHTVRRTLVALSPS